MLLNSVIWFQRLIQSLEMVCMCSQQLQHHLQTITIRNLIYADSQGEQGFKDMAMCVATFRKCAVGEDNSASTYADGLSRK
ncbi:putative cysteine protease ATG4, partial [Bienertia sinuspersici]